MRLEPGADEHLHLPGEMARAHGAATEVASRRDPYAGPLRGADRREGLLAQRLARVLRLREAAARGIGEPDEALENAQGRDQYGLPGHRLRGLLVDAEAVLDRVDAGLGRDEGALALRVRGDPLSSLVYRGDRGGELVDRERDLIAGAPGVDRDLDQIGS